MAGDDVLERNQEELAAVLERHEARQDLSRDLDAREDDVAVERVAHQYGEAQREVRDVREGPAGRDRERREGREYRALEVDRELVLVGGVELVDRDEPNPLGGQRGANVAFEAGGQARALFERADADRRDRLGRRHAVLARLLETGVDLVTQAGDPHHVELVEVRCVDRAELDALQQRHVVVLGELEHAVVEVHPRELAVDEELGARRLRGARAASIQGQLAAHRIQANTARLAGRGR